MDAEQARMGALRALDILDTPPDPTLDKITALAAELFDTPNAAISLIDENRQWTKSRAGDVPDEAPRELSFCNHAIHCPAGETLLVEDARLDPRFCDNPFVTAPGGLRFYLGAPLVDKAGHALGALCVFDGQVHRDLPERERRRLLVLAQLVMDEFELRKAAKTLVEAQRLLTLAESMAGVGHWHLSRDGRVTWSDELYRIHGTDRASFDPDFDSGVAFYHPEDQAKVSTAVDEAMRTGKGFSFDLRIRRRDGALRHVTSRGACQSDRRGEITGLFGVFQDVTDQHELVEAANAASRAKSDFLANMSHELRTPLNSIIGFTHVLVRDATLAPEHRHQLTRIEEAGRGLLAVVNDVLDFSKIESEGLKLSARPFSPVRLMENLVALAHPGATDKGLSLVVDYPAERDLYVEGDVDRLRQVLMNLLTNAVKFTHQGEVRLSLRGRRRDGEVELAFQVTDTGIGIPADKIESLFKRFAQADGSISREFGGTGLGLAISKRLVQGMGGEIAVWSELGHGATFEVRLRLPAAAAPEAEPAPASATAQMDGRRIRVLVAEDVAVNQELVRLMLAPLGCEVTMVSDGDQAVDAVGDAEDDPFDLILMDMQMPVMDGLDATRMIRRLGGAAARTPIIALTANVLPDQIERCRRAGMDDHVAKPFVTEDLQSAVLKWAERPLTAEPATAANPVLADLAAQIGAEPIRRLLASLDVQLAQAQGTSADIGAAALARLAHSLRGASGALGYGEVMDACQAVETAHRESAPIEAAFAALQHACGAARRDMEPRLAA